MFLRERHDLEQKIGTLQDMLERSGDEEQVFLQCHGSETTQIWIFLARLQTPTRKQKCGE